MSFSEESFVVFFVGCYGTVATFNTDEYSALDQSYTHPLISGSLLVSHLYAFVLSHSVVCAMINNGRKFFSSGENENKLRQKPRVIPRETKNRLRGVSRLSGDLPVLSWVLINCAPIAFSDTGVQACEDVNAG